MIICFELTMPNVGSWNGRWTGESKKYYRFRNLTKKEAEKLLKGKERRSWHYSWDDGWGANVTAEHVYAAEKNKRQRKSAGFCGYEWMIDSILKADTILNTQQMKAWEEENKTLVQA